MSSGTFALFALLTVLIGALIPVQAATNALVGRTVGSIPFAALVFFATGFASVLLWILVTRPAVPSISALRQVPASGYVGGVIIAGYVLLITYLAPLIGVGNAICLIVTGQIIGAVTIDHFGLFASIVQRFSPTRALGVALMIAGLFLAKRR